MKCLTRYIASMLVFVFFTKVYSAELIPPPPSKYIVSVESFMRVHLMPERFDRQNGLYVEVRGVYGGGVYKSLYYSESRMLTNDYYDSIMLKFTTEFLEKYDLSECKNMTVNIIGQVYTTKNGLGGIHNIVAIKNSKIDRKTGRIDTSRCYFDDSIPE